jgi:hypothetical protein
MAAWPGTLPDKVLKNGYDEVFADNVIRTPMEVGPPKVRRRSTAAPKFFRVSQLLSSTQVGYLDTFYNTTLSSGSIQFDWKHPRTGSAVTTMRFKTPPRVQYVSGDKFRAEYELEIL